MQNKHNLFWLKALGSTALPGYIEAAGACYRLAATFKHDFFAATGLYDIAHEATASHEPMRLWHKAVLKVGRTADLFGMPMAAIGRWLAHREARAYATLHDVEGVPRFLGMWQDNGFVHEYVEGHPLRRHEIVNDEFFPRLAALLAAVHAHDMAYVDLEKRENILVGDDGKPYLIDFQISFMLPAGRWKRSRLARFLLRRLQESDRYHLLKHHRRHRPDQLTPEQLAASRRRPIYIDLHRYLFRPWTLLRRRTLTRLHGGEWKSREGSGPA